MPGSTLIVDIYRYVPVVLINLNDMNKSFTTD